MTKNALIRTDQTMVHDYLQLYSTTYFTTYLLFSSELLL